MSGHVVQLLSEMEMGDTWDDAEMFYIYRYIRGSTKLCLPEAYKNLVFLAPAARHLQAEGIQIQMGTICNLQCFQRSKMDFPLYLARKKRLSRFLGRSKRLNCHLDSGFFQKNCVFGKIHSGVFWRISGVISRNSGVNNRTLTMDDIF